MKKKIFLDENSPKSLKRLTLEANKIIEQLEKEVDSIKASQSSIYSI